MRRLWLLLPFAAALGAQSPPDRLTLAEADAIAVKNHPLVASALLNALAANQVTAEVRSAYYPSFFASLTGAGAADGTRLAAGQLNNPIIYNRFASGVTLSQTITDFGRTGNLVAASRFRAQQQEDQAQATRAQVLLEVHRAYFNALRARTLLTVSEQTVAARQLIVDQVTALANSKLKSGLDVSFARVNLAEARIMLAGAKNELNAAYADLSAALGYGDRHTFDLADEPMPPPVTPDVSQLIDEALRQRPEAAALRSGESAAQRFARAEKALSYPTLSAVASAGAIPGHQDALRGRYGALGFNVNIPVFNGHLYTARRSEAELKAQAAAKDLKDTENRIARDVNVAWLNADTAFQRLGLTAELLQQASLALDLAQARYDIGLGSIVELSQAQLNKTSAEISSAAARYEYQLQYAVLDYQTGALK